MSSPTILSSPQAWNDPDGRRAPCDAQNSRPMTAVPSACITSVAPADAQVRQATLGARMGLFSRRKPAADRRADATADAREATARAPQGLRRHPGRGRGVRRAADQRHADDDDARRHGRGVDAAPGARTRDGRGELARELGIPVYDVQRTGYPQRVRDWNSRQRLAQQAQARLGDSAGGARLLEQGRAASARRRRCRPRGCSRGRPAR